MTSISARQRMLSLGVAGAVNVAALALLLTLHSRPPEPAKDAGAMTLVSVNDQEVPAAVIVPAIILRQIAVMQALPEPAPEPAGEAANAAGADACAILDSVAKAIVADPATVAAIVQAPADTRSIADAIVIWNVGWSATAMEAGAPLEPVRANVIATLQAAPEDCLASPVAGPRLVPVPNGDRTLFLVFGSGEWSWKSLIEPVPVETAGDTTGLGFL